MNVRRNRQTNRENMFVKCKKLISLKGENWKEIILLSESKLNIDNLKYDLNSNGYKKLK